MQQLHACARLYKNTSGFKLPSPAALQNTVRNARARLATCICHVQQRKSVFVCNVLLCTCVCVWCVCVCVCRGGVLFRQQRTPHGSARKGREVQ